MASAVLGRLLQLSAVRNSPLSPLSPSAMPGRTVTPSRTAVCSSSGAILPKPRKVGTCGTGEQTPFGLMRIALVVIPFLYVGTQISKSFAALLEEHDIFVPEDDDDDD
ncbi:essential MCU regulator, mitochondrial-like isoform X1 [Cyprinodon tularosa]|uniref:essential MCU regulator, mitochondrial isoform X1 n=1 Tax=Cyprinodon variegatus TaxID=28743 RepID=UPI0007427134|nr:PREDICTED: essential MCU regulator, mitochondrial isoform X1 [Cyprinodon variegatus]XP_038129667.1 essential MCU regulator, mitochondrial-like isoform X1 [Cyprinodon tularosa]